MLCEACGEAICSPTITRRLTGYFATPMGDSKTTADQAFPNLSEREHEILSLIAVGYTNAAIASRLYLSRRCTLIRACSKITKSEPKIQAVAKQRAG